MRLPDFQYMAPSSLQEAALFLKEHGHESKIIGGGTDILPSMKQRIFSPKYVVSLEDIPDLDRVEFDEQSGLRIGASVKLRSLETDPIILDRYPIISQAAHAVGSLQLRQMGTVGGNLSLDTRCIYYNQTDFWRKCRPRCIKMDGETCNAVGGGKKCFAVFSGDLAPALITLGAKIKLHSYSGERTISLSELYTGNGAKPLVKEPTEVLMGVEIPSMPKDAFSLYLKYRIRKSIDFPLASVAVFIRLEGKKTCHDSRMVLGAVGPKPQELDGIHELLEGKNLSGSIIEEASSIAYKAAKPVANAGSVPSYRKKIVNVFVKKALEQALQKSA